LVMLSALSILASFRSHGLNLFMTKFGHSHLFYSLCLVTKAGALEATYLKP
jgi:hypothetical protein